MDPTIHYDESLNYSDSFVFFLREYAKLIELGHANPVTTWNTDTRVVWASMEGKPVGVMAFSFNKNTKAGWIYLSSVDPEYRRRGIYQAMHKRMREELKKLGAKKVESLVHVSNDGMVKAAATLGMEPQYYRMHMVLPK